MCGIFGIILQHGYTKVGENLAGFTDNMLKLSESRGKEASGIAVLHSSKITILKEPITGSKFIHTVKYKNLFRSLKKHSAKNSDPVAMIGHSRLATNGMQTKNTNNQPVVSSGLVGIHNGIIVNDHEIWNMLSKKPSLQVDTEAFLELVNYYFKKNLSFREAVKSTYAKIEGSASVAILNSYEPEIVLATNTGSLYFIKNNNPGCIIFASEHFILRKFLETAGHIFHRQNEKINRVRPGTGYGVNIFSLQLTPFNLSLEKIYPSNNKKVLKQIYKIFDLSDKNALAPQNVLSLYNQTNNIKILKNHDFDYKKISKLGRCTKCILPITTPYIFFDKNGVCNYCKEHIKIEYKGKKALEKLVEPFRSRNGDPDCIIGFSGGRDSSYALHYLKKVMGLNPIAYTYDWGMVTDVARRNEARMVGKLGIEHIIVSADITAKRINIKKNILAWMKKPDLGIIPLFMSGEKQCEYYADQLSRKTGIKLIFFARGNEFENEEFKTGHCGIKNADPGGVIHNLAVSGKLKLAMYYAWQYLINPAYINSSVFDTLFAYFSTYIQPHDYVYLWHYIPWNEDKIVSTLTKEYRWETPKDSNSTWRVDDGSPAFYNYIYYKCQGFTENDSFRSRQVREGVLSRQSALKLVNEENKPRYEALKWYFDSVGLDGNSVLKVVDKMPELY